jgi:SAM-dependent methyltransferase
MERVGTKLGSTQGTDHEIRNKELMVVKLSKYPASTKGPLPWDRTSQWHSFEAKLTYRDMVEFEYLVHILRNASIILDLGCGQGRVNDILFKKAPTVVGVDVSMTSWDWQTRCMVVGVDPLILS